MNLFRDVRPRLRRTRFGLSRRRSRVRVPSLPQKTCIDLLLSSKAQPTAGLVALSWYPLAHEHTLLPALGMNARDPAFIGEHKRHVAKLVRALAQANTRERGPRRAQRESASGRAKPLFKPLQGGTKRGAEGHEARAPWSQSLYPRQSGAAGPTPARRRHDVRAPSQQAPVCRPESQTPERTLGTAALQIQP